MQNQIIKNFAGAGMDTDSAPEAIASNDYREAFHFRSGTAQGEDSYGTNIESNIPVAGTILNGLNKCIGSRGFEEIRQAVFAIYNSAGNHQIGLYDLDTNTQRIIYTDKTNSGGQQLLKWNPKRYLNFILIDNTYLAWADGVGEVGFTNLLKLASGAYGVVQEQDLTLIKPQPLIPITAVYANDGGRGGNFIKGKLFQFTSQFEGYEYDRSTYATWSKRAVPVQESTPVIGTDSSQNNAIIVSVYAGTDRVKTLRVAARYDNNNYAVIKTVERTDMLLLPFTSVDITNEVYEAYNPSTGIYSFVFYNDSLAIPIPPVETDQFYDYIWVANAIERLNGNIIAMGDLKVGYSRPQTKVTLQATGYDPNLSVPNEDQSNRMRITYQFPGASGSGEGDHRRRMVLVFAPQPKSGDRIDIVMEDLNNAASTKNYSVIVQPSQENHLDYVMESLNQALPTSSYTVQDDGQIRITWVDDPYFGLRNASVSLANTGAKVSKSIHGLLDNSSYQLALSYRDKYGRPFPLETGNSFIIKTSTFAQLRGGTSAIQWGVQPAAPVGAYDYQWLITKNTTATNVLDVLGSVVKYIGGWEASVNQPELKAGTGTVGDTYQVTTPNNPDQVRNLGNGAVSYNAGDYVMYNGNSWDVVPKTFGDLSSTGGIMAIKINPLALFNQRYANSGGTTVLGYDYSQGDRCTLHSYFDPATPSAMTYINSPTVDLDIYGYDAGSYLLKVQKSSTLDEDTLSGKELYIRLYTPYTQKATSEATNEESTLFFEIGERFTITNGMHDAQSGIITEGDVYFKTRSYDGAVNPNNNYNLLATDFNFSDFYPSAFTSYGRPRSYYDVLEKTEQKASIIFSQNYILGSRNNGLSRFYAANLYGDGDGQTSSSRGAIQVLWMNGSTLVVLQEVGIFYIPVNQIIIQDQAEQQQIAISEKLLNPGRYSTAGSVGIGMAKESFCYNDKTNDAYFIDPNHSEPFTITGGGVFPISGKMSKYFKETLRLAYAQDRKIVMFYNRYYDELVLCLQDDNGNLATFPFDAVQWNLFDGNNITAGDVVSISDPANATATYNPATGLATITPDLGFVGNNVVPFSFNFGGVVVTKNLCVNWTAGNTNVYQFSFAPKFDQQPNTQIESNVIQVVGNSVSTPISIINGQYRVNGGAWVSIAGRVKQYDAVQVRRLSSPTPETMTSATLTIGNQSGIFEVTTGDGGMVLNPFDFLVFRVKWTSDGGQDLDQAAGFIETGTPYDIDYANNLNWVGFNSNSALHNTVSASGTPLYLQWAGDNTSNGVEAVLIDFNKFATDYPALASVKAACYAIWYNARNNGNIQVQMQTYLGGTMSKVGIDFVNTGGTVVDDITLDRNVVSQGTTGNINNNQLVGTINYTIATKTATLS